MLADIVAPSPAATPKYPPRPLLRCSAEPAANSDPTRPRRRPRPPSLPVNQRALAAFAGPAEHAPGRPSPSCPADRAATAPQQSDALAAESAVAAAAAKTLGSAAATPLPPRCNLWLPLAHAEPDD